MAYIRNSIYNDAKELGMSGRDINKLSLIVRKISNVTKKEERMAGQQAKLEAVLQSENEIPEEEYEERD